MKNIDRIRKEMSPARRARIKARADEILAEEMALRDLRQALRRTQETIGEALGIGQDGVSRLEKRSDLLISTLRRYVEAMGGALELIARFPDRPAVLLSGLAEVESVAATKLKRAPASRPRRTQKASGSTPPRARTDETHV